MYICTRTEFVYFVRKDGSLLHAAHESTACVGYRWYFLVAISSSGIYLLTESFGRCLFPPKYRRYRRYLYSLRSLRIWRSGGECLSSFGFESCHGSSNYDDDAVHGKGKTL